MNRKLIAALALMTTCPLVGGLPNLYAEHHEQVALSNADVHPDQVRFHSMIDVASDVYRADELMRCVQQIR